MSKLGQIQDRTALGPEQHTSQVWSRADEWFSQYVNNRTTHISWFMDRFLICWVNFGCILATLVLCFVHTFIHFIWLACLLSTVEPSWRTELLGNRAEIIQTNGPDNIIFLTVKQEYGTKKKHFWVPSAPLTLKLHCSSDERMKQKKNKKNDMSLNEEQWSRKCVMLQSSDRWSLFFSLICPICPCLVEHILHGEIRSNAEQLPVIVEDKRWGPVSLCVGGTSGTGS